MRIGIVSDIHGNRTAFEAVLADLRETAPDLILHGGDLADGGSSPVEIVDRVRDLGWQGVAGNTDEMLFRPESLDEFAGSLPHLKALFDVIGEMAKFSREALGEKRLSWLQGLPRLQVLDPLALVHASPESLWRAPGPEATDQQLQSVYQTLERPLAVYGHIHRPYVRSIGGMTVVNTGSAGLPYDGDPRAAYLLLDDGTPSIRRVDYDLDRECKALAASGLPHAGWVVKMLRTASPQMPQASAQDA
jgi:predicted phosphodiesterase